MQSKHFNQLCVIVSSASAYLGLFVNVINEISSGALTAEDLNVTGTDKRDSYAYLSRLNPLRGELTSLRICYLCHEQRKVSAPQPFLRRKRN